MATIAVSLPASWLAAAVRDAKQDAETERAIVALGGKFNAISTPYMTVSQGPQVPAWLHGLFGDDFFFNCQEICILNQRHVNEAMPFLNRLPRTEALYLTCSRVSDDALKNVESLHDLRLLCLANTRVDDAGLAAIRNLRQLRVLILGNGISNAGLANLRSLDNLQVLQLYGRAISDAGLASLADLGSLEELTLMNMRVTGAGLKLLGIFHICTASI